MCAGGVLRALCGVAGGASKGVLRMHFARKEGGGGVGELNAVSLAPFSRLSFNFWSG